AHAQPPAKVPRIGVLWERTPTDPFIAAFRQGLRELGYIEGQSMVIEERYADGVVDRYPALVTELLDLNVNVLVVAGTNAEHAASLLLEGHYGYAGGVLQSGQRTPVRMGSDTPKAQALSGDHDGFWTRLTARSGPVRRRGHPRSPARVLGL